MIQIRKRNKGSLCILVLNSKNSGMNTTTKMVIFAVIVMGKTFNIFAKTKPKTESGIKTLYSNTPKNFGE